MPRTANAPRCPFALDFFKFPVFLFVVAARLLASDRVMEDAGQRFLRRPNPPAAPGRANGAPPSADLGFFPPPLPVRLRSLLLL